MAPLRCYGMNRVGMNVVQRVASNCELRVIDLTLAAIWCGYGVGAVLWHGLPQHGFVSVCGA